MCTFQQEIVADKECLLKSRRITAGGVEIVIKISRVDARLGRSQEKKRVLHPPSVLVTNVPGRVGLCLTHGGHSHSSLINLRSAVTDC